jgi:hypothetical protein
MARTDRQEPSRYARELQEDTMKTRSLAAFAALSLVVGTIALGIPTQTSPTQQYAYVQAPFHASDNNGQG